MTTKNPYTRLVESARQFAFNVKYRHRREMFRYPEATTQKGYRLDDLYQRVAAADQLGYDVELKCTEKGELVVQYVKRIADAPYPFRPD